MPNAARRAILRFLAADAVPAASASVAPEAHLLVAEAAALTFEAWTHSDDEWTPPTDEEWILGINPMLAPARVAWRTLFTSKAELVKILDAARSGRS